MNDYLEWLAFGLLMAGAVCLGTLATKVIWWSVVLGGLP